MSPGPRRGASTLFLAVLVLAFGAAMLVAAAPHGKAAKSKAERSQEARAYSHYSDGRQAFGSGRWKQAAHELEQATEENPSFKDAWYLLGIAEYQLGAYEKAEKALKEVTALDSRNYNAWMWLANCALARGEYDQARTYARSIFKFDPRSFLGYYALGIVEYTQGRIQPAHEDWDRSRALWGEYAPTLYNLGVAEYNLHAPQKAIARLRSAILEDSRNPKYQFVLGWYAYQYHDFGTAFVNFRRILDDDRNRSTEYGAAARALLALQHSDFATAKREVEAALKMDPQFGQGWLLKGMLLKREGNKDEAVAAYCEALALDPLDVDARQGLTDLGVKPPPVGPARLPSEKSTPSPATAAKPSPSPSSTAAAKPSPWPTGKPSPSPQRAAKQRPSPPGAGPGVPVPAPSGGK